MFQINVDEKLVHDSFLSFLLSKYCSMKQKIYSCNKWLNKCSANNIITSLLLHRHVQPSKFYILVLITSSCTIIIKLHVQLQPSKVYILVQIAPSCTIIITSLCTTQQILYFGATFSKTSKCEHIPYFKRRAALLKTCVL